MLELLVDGWEADLPADAQAELEALLRDAPVRAEELERSAAAAHLAFQSEAPWLPLPASLRDRLVDEAVIPAPVVALQQRPPPTFVSVWPWAVAAAAAIGAFVLGQSWAPLPPSNPPAAVAPSTPVEPEARMLALLASGSPVTRVPWSTTEDPYLSGEAVEGEVVWSPSRQEGYMVFTGLRANDPAQHQYQLWIFDQTRGDQYPVDGGVFDVATGEDRVVIPIDPKLAVDQAVLFAVTLERPGGVVVSDRSHILVLAKPSA
jgi:hypothetical protein